MLRLLRSPLLGSINTPFNGLINATYLKQRNNNAVTYLSIPAGRLSPDYPQTLSPANAKSGYQQRTIKHYL